jgi:hypothetical protein
MDIKDLKKITDTLSGTTFYNPYTHVIHFVGVENDEINKLSSIEPIKKIIVSDKYPCRPDGENYDDYCMNEDCYIANPWIKI